MLLLFFSFFFFNDTATTEIYPLSLHDALPISPSPRRRTAAPTAARGTSRGRAPRPRRRSRARSRRARGRSRDRKSTRLNSSHQIISYAVFCLKKKKKKISHNQTHDRPHTTHDD